MPGGSAADVVDAVLSVEVETAAWAESAARTVDAAFADHSLQWDAWLLRRVRREGAEGWVPLGALAGRPALGGPGRPACSGGRCDGGVEALAAALRDTSVVPGGRLEVSEDGQCVRRVAPLGEWTSAEAQARTVIVDNIPEGKRDEVSVRGLCEPAGAIRGVRLGGLDGGEGRCRPAEGPGGRVFNISTGFHALVEFEEEAVALEAPKVLTDKSNWRSGLRVRLLVDRKADKMFQRSEDAAERAKAGDAGESKAGAAGEGEEAPQEAGGGAADEGPAFQKAGRKGRKKKDYAAWAAATPAFRSQAVAQQSGGADGEGGTATGLEPGTDVAPGPPRSGHAAPSAGAGRGGRRQPTMPDGTRGFAAGRGRPLAAAPPS